MPELYKLDFSDGRSFIGRTIYSGLKAARKHRWDAAHGRQTPLADAFRRLGEPALTILAVLEHRQLKPSADRAIKVFDTETPNGYNFPTKIDAHLWGAWR